MITLHVGDYCQKCPHFEAETEEISSLFSYNFIIKCAHAEKCRALLNYIKENQEACSKPLSIPTE